MERNKTFRGDLVRLYCGPRPRLPHDVCWWILEYSGMCGGTPTVGFFWIYM